MKRFIIVIGAARSGTKLMRDLIARHPDVDRVPYDVNYIWRMGNESVPHDELTADRVTPAIRERILEQLERYRADASQLVEKTVSNCLRVPFVDAILPEASYIHLIRDGRDVVESVRRTWLAPTDWSYVLRKARSFPFTKALGYAVGYATRLAGSVVTPRRSSGTWGPRYDGIDSDLARTELLDVCATQWIRSVRLATDGLAAVDPERVHRIRYEDLTASPAEVVAAAGRFAGLDAAAFDSTQFTDVATTNVGKWRSALSRSEQTRLMDQIGPTLDSLGYD